LTFLFERILIRITDPRIKALTSPGLLLRHITADLIHKVLAQPCGLGEMTEAEAQKLFDDLAGHVWLVRQEGDRLLSHRRDLRRLMLPGIYQHYPDICEQINERAVAYYESAPAHVSESEARLEAAYHRGFLPDIPVYSDPLEARRIISQLGADLLDWPVHATALIKHAAQLPERLTEDELESLSHTHTITSRAMRAQQWLSESSAKTAAQAIVNSEKDAELYQDEIPGERESAERARSMRLAFHQGRFEHISERANSALRPLFRKREALAATHYWQDDTLLDQIPWLVALSVLAEPDAGEDVETIIPVRALDAVQATPRRVGIDSTFELFYMLAIASLMNDQRAVESLSSFLRSSLPCFAPPIKNAAQLQILQLSVRAIISGDLIGQRDLITLENCDCLRFDSLSLPISENHPDTRHNRQRLALAERTRDAFIEQRPTADELDEYLQHLQLHKVDVLGPAGLDLLSSRQDTLYPCIRFALETVSPTIVQSVLTDLSEQSCYWPAEFTPEVGQAAPVRGYGKMILASIIKTADRCGLLATLLDGISVRIADPLLHEELRLLQRLDRHLTG
jgi:hypothetical protein